MIARVFFQMMIVMIDRLGDIGMRSLLRRD
jgi:hypothetical protein